LAFLVFIRRRSTEHVSDLLEAVLDLRQEPLFPLFGSRDLRALPLQLLSGPVDGKFLLIEEFFDHQKFLYILVPVEALVLSGIDPFMPNPNIRTFDVPIPQPLMVLNFRNQAGET
jgi:hypothetical protein